MMMQCFHFMVEPAKNFTAKIKVTNFGAFYRIIVCLICKPASLLAQGVTLNVVPVDIKTFV